MKPKGRKFIKYFHELTKKEFDAIPKATTYLELGEMYPPPPWCSHWPEAVYGIMGCASLCSFMVTGEDYCKGCDQFLPTGRRNKP